MHRIFFALSVCAVILAVPVLSHAKVEHRCHMCGMDAAESQTEFVVHLSDGSEEHACCLHCVFLLKNFMQDREFVKVETRDFAAGTLIDAEQAFYLIEGSKIPKGSMAPFILGFPDAETAGKYQAKYGGKVVDWAEAMATVEQFDNELNSEE